MNLIDEKQATKDLEALEAGSIVKELILNNIRLYNDLLERDLSLNSKLNYLVYQLNVQIAKQFNDLRKLKKRLEKEKEEKGGGINKLIKSIQGEGKKGQKKHKRTK